MTTSRVVVICSGAFTQGSKKQGAATHAVCDSIFAEATGREKLRCPCVQGKRPDVFREN